MSVAVGYSSAPTSNSLTVYNLPFSASEMDVRSVFPTAQRVNLIKQSNESQGMCVIQFDSPYECQKVFTECQSGKEVAGRMLHAEYTESRSSNLNNQDSCRNTAYSTPTNYERQPQYAANSSNERVNLPTKNYMEAPKYGNNSNNGSRAADCNLAVSNLPYSATERDVWNEFPEALKVVLNLDERGRSRGTAQLSFTNRDQCNAALQACNYKTLNGRPIRGRVIRESDDDNNRQRDFGGRQRENYSNNHNDYNSERRNVDNRFSSSGNRGGNRWSGNGRDNVRGGSGNNRFGGRDSHREERSESFNRRRDRSPPRDEPVRGYGSTRGPRITSAVINRSGDPSSESSSDED